VLVEEEGFGGVAAVEFVGEEGEALGLRVFRKHLGWYVERAPWPDGPEARRQAKAALCRLQSAREVEQGLVRLWLGAEPPEALKAA